MNGRCHTAISAILLLLIAAPARAAGPTTQDLAAISHTLGFVQGIPRTGNIRVGVVYAPTGDTARMEAVATADALAATAGPGTTTLAPTAIAADAIGGAGNLNALLLMPGTDGVTPTILAEATRRRIATVSTDPQCLTRQSCVLWVQAEPHVAVTLDTGLAAALSVKISPIFAMMVKRK